MDSRIDWLGISFAEAAAACECSSTEFASPIKERNEIHLKAIVERPQIVGRLEVMSP